MPKFHWYTEIQQNKQLDLCLNVEILYNTRALDLNISLTYPELTQSFSKFHCLPLSDKTLAAAVVAQTFTFLLSSVTLDVCKLDLSPLKKNITRYEPGFLGLKIHGTHNHDGHFSFVGFLLTLNRSDTLTALQLFHKKGTFTLVKQKVNTLCHQDYKCAHAHPLAGHH